MINLIQKRQNKKANMTTSKNYQILKQVIFIQETKIDVICIKKG